MPSVTWPDRLAIAAPPDIAWIRIGRYSPCARPMVSSKEIHFTHVPTGPGHRRSIHPTVRLGLKGLSSRHPRMSRCDRARHRARRRCHRPSDRRAARVELPLDACSGNGRPRDPSGRRPVVRPDRARPARAGQRAASASPGSDSPTRPCPDSRRRRRPSSALVQHRGDGKLPPRRATRRNVLPLRRTTQFASGMEPRCRRCRRPRGVTLDWI